MGLDNLSEQASDLVKFFIIPVVAAVCTSTGALYILTSDMRVTLGQVETRQQGVIPRVEAMSSIGSKVDIIQVEQALHDTQINKNSEALADLHDKMSIVNIDHETLDRCTTAREQIEKNLAGITFRVENVERVLKIK